MCTQAAVEGGPSDPDPGCFPGVKDLSHRQDLKDRSTRWPAPDLAGALSRQGCKYSGVDAEFSVVTALQMRILLSQVLCCAELSRLHKRPDCIPGPLCARSSCELRAEVGQALWLKYAISTAWQNSTVTHIIFWSCMAPVPFLSLLSFCCELSVLNHNLSSWNAGSSRNRSSWRS